MLRRIKLICYSVLFFPCLTYALSFDIERPDQQIVGTPQLIKIEQGQTLESISRQYGIGYYEILEANPNVDPLHLKPGTDLFLPTQFILPEGPREGVVINLPELRLYMYSPDGKSVETVPVGIGRQGWETPTGHTAIKDRREHPTWTVPTSVRVDMARRGKMIPAQMPPGPNNPLGDHAMRLDMVGYVIHGTNRPAGVGKRSSAGCIRLFPEDVKKVYEQVEIGTPVSIVNQPYKTAWQDGQLYMEVHQPLAEQRKYYRNHSFALVKKHLKNNLGRAMADVNWDRVKQLISKQDGLPQVISMNN